MANLAHISVAFEPSKERVVVTARGDLAASDIRDTAGRVYRDPQFRPGMKTLLDFRAASPDVTADNVRMIVSFVSRNIEVRGKGRCAIVTGREVDYGMARMAQTYMEPIGIEAMVFREMEDAELWLDWKAVREAHAPFMEPNQAPEFGGE